MLWQRTQRRDLVCNNEMLSIMQYSVRIPWYGQHTTCIIIRVSHTRHCMIWYNVKHIISYVLYTTHHAMIRIMAFDRVMLNNITMTHFIVKLTCRILSYIILYYIILQFSILYRITSYYTRKDGGGYYIILYYIILYYIKLYYIILYCIILDVSYWIMLYRHGWRGAWRRARSACNITLHYNTSCYIISD
jgi:hypothetical protein